MNLLNNLLFLLIGVVSLRSAISTGLKLSGPCVKIKQGALQGKTVTTDSGFQYDSYQGIPYAKPPLGDLRFRNPQPAEPWSGVLNATAPGNSCPQNDPIFQKKYLGAEDCLVLNVYVPNTGVKPRNLPVMFWIHGDGFTFGDGTPVLYGPDGFVEKNVIVVTINYRLGVLGFLSLHTADVPGNAGLKDQVLALKWVKNNIQNFGGNSKKVTIFGEGSGAATAEYHLLSPLSKGLFSAAIFQSGSCLNIWAAQIDPIGVANEVARVSGIGPNDTDIGKFLRTKSAQDLTNAGDSANLMGKLTLPFAPTVERTFPNVVPFITRPPQDLMNSGSFHKVPTITGLNSNDGIIYKIDPYTIAEDFAAISSNNIPNMNKFVPEVLKGKYGVNGTKDIEDEIQQFYFPNKNDLSTSLTDLYTDYAFTKDIVPSVRLLARFSPPAYFYKFSYSGSKNLLRLVTSYQYEGSSLYDELAYMFNVSLNGINQIPLTASDELVSAQLYQMWTNFAKFRTPTPRAVAAVKWRPVSSQASTEITLDIDAPMNLIPNPFAERMKFWDDLLAYYE